jgi:hypothetical protein
MNQRKAEKLMIKESELVDKINEYKPEFRANLLKHGLVDENYQYIKEEYKKEAVKYMPPEYAKLCKQLKAVRAKMYKMALQEKKMVMKAFNLTEADWDALGDEPEQDEDNTPPCHEGIKVSEEGLRKLAHLAGFDNPEMAGKDIILTKKNKKNKSVERI